MVRTLFHSYVFSILSINIFLVVDSYGNIMISKRPLHRVLPLSSGTQTALCALVAATNVGAFRPTWSCTSSGTVTTQPCSGGTSVWACVTCSGGDVTSISLNGIGLTGFLF